MENLESRYLLAGSDEANAVVIRINPSDSAIVDVVVDGRVTTFSLGDKVVLDGRDGDDTLTVDLSNGMVQAAIEFDGGEGRRSRLPNPRWVIPRSADH